MGITNYLRLCEMTGLVGEWFLQLMLPSIAGNFFEEELIIPVTKERERRRLLSWLSFPSELFQS